MQKAIYISCKCVLDLLWEAKHSDKWSVIELNINALNSVIIHLENTHTLEHVNIIIIMGHIVHTPFNLKFISSDGGTHHHINYAFG